MTSVVHYKSLIISTRISSSKVEKFGQAQGIEKQQAKLLPVSCFLPCATNHAINPLILANQKVIADASRLAWRLSEMLRQFEQKYPGEFWHHLTRDYLSGHAILYPKYYTNL